jgi:hypothetical protein
MNFSDNEISQKQPFGGGSLTFWKARDAHPA